MKYIDYLPNYLFAITVFNLFAIGCVFLNYIVVCVSWGKILSIKEYFYKADEYFFGCIGVIDGILCGISTLIYVFLSIFNS